MGKYYGHNYRAAGTKAKAHKGSEERRERSAVLDEIEALRDRTALDKSIRVGSTEWKAVVKRCAELRRELRHAKRKRKAK